MKYAVSCLLFVSSLGLAQTPMVSFDELRARYKAHNDWATLEYVFVRCAALHSIMSAFATNAGQDTAANAYANAGAMSIEFALVMHKLKLQERGLERNAQDVTRGITETTSDIALEYNQLLRKNMARTGNYFDGNEQVKSELPLCNDPARLFTWMGAEIPQRR